MSCSRRTTGVGVLWGSVLAEATSILAQARVDTPQIDARRIIEEATGAGLDEFYELLQQPVTAQAASRVDAMLDRRCAGEPLQYVIGRWGFRTLDLLVDQRVLIPRPETEIVAGWAISYATKAVNMLQQCKDTHDLSSANVDIPPEAPVVVDLGTGSGAIALSVAAECAAARVFATDISEEALAVARANLAGLGNAAARVTLHAGNWLEALPSMLKGGVDVLVSNPPYIGANEHLPPIVTDWEPSQALRAGPNGDEIISQLIQQSSVWLSPDGVLILELAPKMSQKMLQLAQRSGFTVRIERDLSDRDRVLIGVKSDF